MDMIDIVLAAKKAIAQLEESGKVAKIEETGITTLTFCTQEPNEEAGGMNVSVFEGTLGIKESDTSFSIDWRIGDTNYIVLTDWQPVTSPIWAGNLGLGGVGDDNGQPLCVIVDFDQNMSLVVSSFTGEVELSVSTKFERVVHPIDQKYLPGVCLPMVELTDELIARMDEEPAAGVTLPQNCQDALNRASNQRTPIIVSTTMAGNIASMESPTQYVVTILGVKYRLYYYDAGECWSVTVVH